MPVSLDVVCELFDERMFVLQVPGILMIFSCKRELIGPYVFPESGDVIESLLGHKGLMTNRDKNAKEVREVVGPFH